MALSRDETPKFSLILPVFNAEPFLSSTLQAVDAWLESREDRWELIVVDDASTDRTRAILDRFMRQGTGTAVRCIRFSRNRGKGFAVRAGVAAACGRYVLFTDCDLAYSLENLERIVAALDEGADAAIACRVLPGSTYQISPSFFSYLYTRHLMGRIFNAISRLLLVPGVRDTQAGLKGFRTSAIRPVLARMVLDRFSFDVELLRALLDRGAAITEVPVMYRYDSEPTTVQLLRDSAGMICDLVRVRLRSWFGCYRWKRSPARLPRIVINADDYGLAPGINRAIEEGLASGAIDRASILQGTSHAAEAITWAAQHPQYPFGIHLNLTVGRPVSPPGSVPTLVDGNGRFRSLPGVLWRLATGRIRREEVMREWAAQLSNLRECGVDPGHLDGHQHVHLLPGLYRRITMPLARREELRVRLMDGPIRGTDPKALLLAAVSRSAALVAGVRPGACRGFGTSIMRKATLRRLRSLLSGLRPGYDYEWTVHPGYVDVELEMTGDRYLEGRERERHLLASEEARAVLALAGGTMEPPVSGVPSDGRRASPSGPNSAAGCCAGGPGPPGSTRPRWNRRGVPAGLARSHAPAGSSPPASCGGSSARSR